MEHDVEKKYRREGMKKELDKHKKETGYDAVKEEYKRREKEAADSKAKEYVDLAEEHDEAGALPVEEKADLVKAKLNDSWKHWIPLAVLAAIAAAVYFLQ